MKNYEEEIKQKLLDSTKWPDIRKPDVMARLDEMADNALSTDNISESQCIASILIVQQLTEELIKILVEASQFLVQVNLLPLEIKFKRQDGKMFGRVLEELKTTIDLPKKDKLIVLASKINRERINVAHKLVDNSSFDDLPNIALQVRSNFEEFFTIFYDTYDWIRLCLKDAKTNLECRQEDV